MSKTLFLLCPTDCLEATINQMYKSENYFYSTLGNSFNINTGELKHIKELISKENIENIYFVLSTDNKIILDALRGHFFSDIKGLKKLYQEIGFQRKITKKVCAKDENQMVLLSYYLNKKIKSLNFSLDGLSIQPHIQGKIYCKDNNSLIDIYPEILCLEAYSFN